MDALEFEIEAHGDIELNFETPGIETGSLFVVVESIDGAPLEYVQVITGLEPTSGLPIDSDGGGMAMAPLPTENDVTRLELAPESNGQIQAFADNLPAEATSVALRVGGTEKRHLRVFIGWVKGLWPQTPCSKCKAIVKAVLRVARAAGGDFGMMDLAESVMTFIAETLGEEALGFMQNAVRAAGAIGRAMDRIANEVCSQLGYCP